MAALSALNLLTLSRAAPALYARHGQRLPAIVCIVLVVVAARLLAELAWALVPMPAAAAWQPVAPPPTPAMPGSAIDLAVISNAALFGRYQPVATPVVNDAATAPDTQLNLTLLGILADSRDPSSSRALILTQGGDEKPYSVGDDIARGVTLQAIFSDRVILARGGKLETLRLDKDSPNTGLPPAVIADQAPAEPASNAAASLTAIRTQILADPSKAQDFIRVQPVNSGSGINGYRIYPGKDRSVFTAAGLKPGDIVTSVNGVQLNDPSKALQLLSDLSQTSQLNLTVDRGGQPQNFNINLNQ